MYVRSFRNAEHIRRFTITDTMDSGWEVREERDSRVVKSVRYTDWHRVERALLNFASESATLQLAGWIETSP